MHTRKPGHPRPMPESADLLRQAERSALRTSSDAALCDLLALLDLACEAVRPVAVRNVLDAPRRGAGDIIMDRTCGFASLYDALRRTRAEIARRNIAPHRLTAAAARHGKYPARSKPALRARPSSTRPASPRTTDAG